MLKSEQTLDEQSVGRFSAPTDDAAAIDFLSYILLSGGLLLNALIWAGIVGYISGSIWVAAMVGVIVAVLSVFARILVSGIER